MRSVLIVDDEASIRDSMKGALEDEGYHVDGIESGLLALDRLEKKNYEILFLDIWMPGMDGLDTLKKIKERNPNQLVIMMSGHGTIDTAVRATKMGAYDFVEKPINLERVLLLLQNALQTQDLARTNSALREQIQKQRVLIGETQSIQDIHQLVKQVAPTTGSVLITGENGTGKEVVAHSVHALSQRFSKPFVEVNCAAIPEELIESELFGHERGAFTGADKVRRGKFDLANNGTLFLDEIGDMSLKTQAKVLRILQEQKFERVGGTETISVDVRVIAATNKDLKQSIAKGEFREDLFYRLNVIRIQLPPLRERKKDIPLLANFFLKELIQQHAKFEKKLGLEAMNVLTAYDWPGNVRELKNLIERLVILTPEDDRNPEVSAAQVLNHMKEEVTQSQIVLPPEFLQKHQSAGKSLRDARGEFEREFIIKTLKENDWNISKAAQILGIERSYLHKKIKSYGIETS